MKKILSILAGTAILAVLASCGEKDNKELQSLISGKSNAEVVNMIVTKYQDEEFLTGFSTSGVKAKADVDAEIKSTDSSMKVSGDVTVVGNSTQGAQVKASGEITSEGKKMSADATIEYDKTSSNVYLNASYPGVESIKYYLTAEEILELVGDNNDFGDLVPGDGGMLPDIGDADIPTDSSEAIEEIIAFITENEDKISTEVSGDDLILKYVVDSKFIKDAALEEGYELTTASAEVSVSFNSDLYFSGLSIEFSGSDSTGMTASFEANLSIKYGDYTYKALSGKTDYVHMAGNMIM